MAAMIKAPASGPLLIQPLKSRYPIWAVRAADSKTLLGIIGSAALWIDLRTEALDAPLGPANDINSDGRIDVDDLNSAFIQVDPKGLEIGGAQYQLDQLVGVANRYQGEVPGKTVSMPKPERNFMDLLALLGVVEEIGKGYKAPKKASFIFLTRGSDKGDLDHELTHVVFASEESFRSRVAKIWKRLPPVDRKNVRKSLGKVYDLKGKDVLMTEFAAYAVDGFPKSSLRNPPPKSSALKKASRRLRKARAGYLPPDAK